MTAEEELLEGLILEGAVAAAAGAAAAAAAGAASKEAVTALGAETLTFFLTFCLLLDFNFC